MARMSDCGKGKAMVYTEVDGKIMVYDPDMATLVAGTAGNAEGSGSEVSGAMSDCIYAAIDEPRCIGADGSHVTGDAVGVFRSVYKVSYEGATAVESTVGGYFYLTKLNLTFGRIHR